MKIARWTDRWKLAECAEMWWMVEWKWICQHIQCLVYFGCIKNGSPIVNFPLLVGIEQESPDSSSSDLNGEGFVVVKQVETSDSTVTTTVKSEEEETKTTIPGKVSC